MKRTVISMMTAGALALAGCGGGSNGSGGTEAVSMVVGEAVSVYPGDSVTPTDDAARIAIRHQVGEEVKTVTLLEGSADLLRGEYQLSR